MYSNGIGQAKAVVRQIYIAKSRTAVIQDITLSEVTPYGRVQLWDGVGKSCWETTLNSQITYSCNTVYYMVGGNTLLTCTAAIGRDGQKL